MKDAVAAAFAIAVNLAFLAAMNAQLGWHL